VLHLSIGSSPDDALPFRGLRVLDLGTFWAGPYMGMYLASLGADVVKIESSRRPDGFRFIAAMEQGDDFYERGALFQATNLGKRDLTLDLSHERGRELLGRLIEGADVLIENFAPRVMERFGFDYEAVRARRPDIVMVRMPAYGLVGEWRDYVGWAMAIAQAAGISWLTGDPEHAPRASGAFLDPAVAMHGLTALQAALAHRRATGEGQLIELAQLETAIAMCPGGVIAAGRDERVPLRTGNRSPEQAPEGVYACSDGMRIALSVRNDDEWRDLAPLIGCDGDSALATLAGRQAEHDRIDEAISTWMGEREAREAIGILHGRGIPAMELLVTPRMYDDPQLAARGYYQTIEHPVSGERRYPGWPMRFSFQPGPVHPRPAPTLGQHNEEILRGELGLSESELRDLETDGVIGRHFAAS